MVRFRAVIEERALRCPVAEPNFPFASGRSVAHIDCPTTEDSIALDD
jgi:hypothetical protein